MPSSSVILASRSPRRESILKQIGIDFEIIPSNICEDAELNLGPKKFVQYWSEKKTKVISKAGLRPMGFSMITIREPYDDIRVRRALNYAVPVDAICEKLFMGYAKPSDSPIAFDTIGHKSIGGFDYNPQIAKSLLKDAGFSDKNNLIFIITPIILFLSLRTIFNNQLKFKK